MGTTAKTKAHSVAAIALGDPLARRAKEAVESSVKVQVARRGGGRCYDGVGARQSERERERGEARKVAAACVNFKRQEELRSRRFAGRGAGAPIADARTINGECRNAPLRARAREPPRTTMTRRRWRR